MKVTIFIEGERLDLFQDESITITQGTQDVKDISKLFADFSQSFNVPASDNNNRIFKHYYNADIDGGFDARTRKDAVIDVNTLDFKRGKIQLEKVEIKDNSPASYNITFFGDAIKVKDLLGDDKLFNLDYLSNFDHDYTGAQVKQGLTQGLDTTVGTKTYTAGIIYPLISYTKQYKYNSNPSDTTNTDTLVNIAYDAGRAQGVDFGDLKPAIKLEAVIDAIEDKYGFNFTGGFFESANYKELYMSLNNSTDQLNAGILTFEQETGNNPPESSLSDDKLRYKCEVIPDGGFTSVPYKIRLTWNDQTIYEDQNFIAGTREVTAFVDRPTEQYDVTASVLTEEDFEFSANTQFRYQFAGGNLPLFTNSYTGLVIDLRVKILDLIYDIEVYDFLTSIFKMFNLIVTPDGTDLLVEDLQTWYASGKIYDISEYVNTSKLTVEKGVIYNQINYSFEESEQILADEYNKNFRRYYGNLELKLYTDSTQTELLDGDKLDIDVVFENPVNERLIDQNTGQLVSTQYMPYFDRELKSLTGNPFLFYAPLTSQGSDSIGFNTEATYDQVSNPIFMPAHTRIIDDSETFAINFNAELSEYTYAVMGNNIYSTYYQDYISDVFSIKRRNYKLEAKFPNEFLQRLKLNDRLVIGDTRYIINKITSNLVKRKDSLELINDIYNAPIASDVVSGGVFSPNAKVYNSSAQSDTTQYLGDSTNAVTLIDTGDGTGWITIDNDPQTVIRTVDFSLSANGGAQRQARMRVINTDLSNADYIITQETS